MKKILIQANNLDTVIDVFMYIYLHPGCKKQAVADYCGFSLRQVDYYTNACKYLGLINYDWSATDFAKDIFENHKFDITQQVYQRIINDELIGQVYKKMQEIPEDELRTFAKELVITNYPGFSEAVYDRRSNNMIKWCKKIINNK